jgi:predicted acetyltransferase
MIANAFQKVGYPIIPALLPASDVDNHLIDNPYGSKLIMRHYSQIVPRDFDLSPNFEIVKYNIIGLGRFVYKSIWANE